MLFSSLQLTKPKTPMLFRADSIPFSEILWQFGKEIAFVQWQMRKSEIHYAWIFVNDVQREDHNSTAHFYSAKRIRDECRTYPKRQEEVYKEKMKSNVTQEKNDTNKNYRS